MQKAQKGELLTVRNKAEEFKQIEDYKAEKRKAQVKQATWAMRLPPINNNDPEQIKERIYLYFEYCAEEGLIIGLEGLCNALKINRTTFRSWLNGTARLGQEHQKICQEADQVIKAYLENATLAGDIQAVPSIFFMSNQHGYEQKSTVKQEQIASVLETATPEQLEKRYSSGSIIDVAFEEKAPPKEIAEVSNQRIVGSVKGIQTSQKADTFQTVEPSQKEEVKQQKKAEVQKEPTPRGRKPKKDITIKIKNI